MKIVLVCLLAYATLNLLNVVSGQAPLIDEIMENQDHQLDTVAYSKKISDFVMSQLLETYFEAVENETCGGDWSLLHEHTQNLKVVGSLKIPLPKQDIAIDAFGKPGAGFFRGNAKYMGDFDECMNIDTKDLDLTMKYCLMSMTVYIMIGGSPVPFVINEAVCIPTSCNLEDLNKYLPAIDQTIGPLIKVYLTLNSVGICTAQGDDRKYSTGAVIMIIVCFVFLGLSLGATGVDVLMQCYPVLATDHNGILRGLINSTVAEGKDVETQPLLSEAKPNRYHVFLYDIVKGFSLYTTVPAVLSTKQPPTAITCINGIRVISMFWVIFCHTYFFFFELQDFSNNFDVMSGFIKRFSAQPILNGFFSVDSFFFLSGVLVAYLTFRQMERRKGSFPFLPYYIHRFFRLTPTYMFVLFFYWFVTVHLGSGPILQTAVGPDSDAAKNCEKYWWTNLLYINNFHPTSFGKECMGWTWYLANDMQFYVISPLLLIPLYYWVPSGLVAVGLTLVASFGVTGFIAGWYEYPANTFWFLVSETTPPPGQPDQSSQIYGKPYCRIAPYLVGILLGYLLYKKYRIPVKKGLLGWVIHLVIWAIAAVLGMINVYAFYPTFHGHAFTKPENVSYFMFSRFTWGVTLFLVVYVCHYGYGGFINSFLSLPVWIPLSRFTFNAYLVHEMVMLLLFSDLRTTVYYDDASFLFYIIGIVVLSFGAAAVVTVFVEFPISNLESAVFKLFGAPLRPSTRIVDRGNRDTSSPFREDTFVVKS